MKTEEKAVTAVTDEAILFLNGDRVASEPIDYSKDSFLSVLMRFMVRVKHAHIQTAAIAVVKQGRPQDVDVIFLQEFMDMPQDDGTPATWHSRMWKTVPGQADWRNYRNQIR